MSKNAKLREKHKWAIEKPKFDNARRLRGIYFIDPEDMEFKEIIENARRKLKTPMAPATPCKTCKKNCRHIHLTRDFSHAPCTRDHTHIVAQGVFGAHFTPSTCHP